MAVSEAHIPLINFKGEEDAFSNGGFDSFYDDTSSSGYGSSDVSDVDSTTSCESCDSDSSFDESMNNLLPSGDNDEEVMNFESCNALCENLKLILAMPEMCDVTFLVGPREIPVHGVKAILGTRSRVMYQLILKSMRERDAAIEEQMKNKKSKKNKNKQPVGIARSPSQNLVIPIKKYDSEVFSLLIQFIHCGSAIITEDTVAGLYCGACQFELADLGRACLEFVDRCLKNGRAEKILFSTRCYCQHKATARLFEMIYLVLDKRYVEYIKQTPV